MTSTKAKAPAAVAATRPRLGLSPTEAAQLMGCHKQSVLDSIHSGALKAKRWGSGYRIKPADLEAWFDSLPDA